ncbi:MAG: hypothetical protein R2741_04135 [Methanolobus sp.]
MVKTIEELENDLDLMNEMFRKYLKLSLNYQKQINNADIPEEQRKVLMDKLEAENEKVRNAKEKMQKFEKTIGFTQKSNDKLKKLLLARKIVPARKMMNILWLICEKP